MSYFLSHWQLLVGLVSTFLLVFILWEFLLMRHRIAIGKSLAEAAVAYEQTGSEQIFLVLGDSSAVGTGATINTASTAGRLGASFPKANIENKGVNGAVVADVFAQIQNTDLEKYDLILLQIGGNDVVQRTELAVLEEDLKKLIKKLRGKTTNLIVLTAGDVGGAPIWPLGVGHFFTKRTEAVREVFLRVVGTDYIDLYTDPNLEGFSSEPYRYHAADTFHPSSLGYGLWYGAVEKRLKEIY